MGGRVWTKISNPIEPQVSTRQNLIQNDDEEDDDDLTELPEIQTPETN